MLSFTDSKEGDATSDSHPDFFIVINHDQLHIPFTASDSVIPAHSKKAYTL